MTVQDKSEIVNQETDKVAEVEVREIYIEESRNEVTTAPSSQLDHIPWYVWCILLISSLGVFMASVSTTALVIAFPVILVDLNMSISTMMWYEHIDIPILIFQYLIIIPFFLLRVLLVLLLMLGTVVPTAGKLGDMFGQSRVYLFGYWTFVIGSFGAGFVSSKNQGYDLIAARVVIGFGAALLFTNSSAILTNAFAPYGKVGLSQGIFQMFSAMGIVLGPVIGGGFATTNWRWIFWFNVPIGGTLAIIATFILKNSDSNKKISAMEQLLRFDYFGVATCVCGLTLIMIALVQIVVADPVLSKTQAIIGLVVAGVVSCIAFIVDQFYATDALIPPDIFNNRIFSLTTAAGTAMAFVRNSITYDMIFFLQGPFGYDPLKAGITLIPYGIGIMAAGFSAGILADRIGSRNMAVIGPLITLAGVACLSVMDEHTTVAYVGGILFLTGLGIGLFQSPNSAANMLSVKPQQRGVAAAVSMLSMSICMMLGIILTFSFVLHSMTSQQLFDLFIYGGGGTGSSNFPIRKCLNAIARDYYIVMACCIAASCFDFFLPTNISEVLAKNRADEQRDKMEAAAQVEQSTDKSLDIESQTVAQEQ
jgi:MFS family permease